MEIITYDKKYEKSIFYSKEDYLPIFWRYLVVEKIKKNLSYKMIDNNLNYYILIEVDNLKRNFYFDNVKNEKYQQILLDYWNYFVDYLQEHTNELLIKGTFRYFDEYENNLLDEYSYKQMPNETYENFLHSSIEKIILDKFNQREFLDLDDEDIDLTQKMIGHVSSDSLDFYSNDQIKIHYLYKLKSTDINFYSFILIILLLSISWNLGDFILNRQKVTSGTFIEFFINCLLFLVELIFVLWLFVFLKDLFVAIYYHFKIKIMK
ncbi:hypothetical protein ACYSNW_16270 [Enterococcus sp. LJL99]